MVSQGQPFLKDPVDSEAVSHLDKSTEIVGKTEKKTNEGIGLESHAPRNDHKFADSDHQLNFLHRAAASLFSCVYLVKMLIPLQNTLSS